MQNTEKKRYSAREWSTGTYNGGQSIGRDEWDKSSMILGWAPCFWCEGKRKRRGKEKDMKGERRRVGNREEYQEHEEEKRRK